MKTGVERNAQARSKLVRRPREFSDERDAWAWVMALGLPGLRSGSEGGSRLRAAAAAPYLQHRHD